MNKLIDKWRRGGKRKKGLEMRLFFVGGANDLNLLLLVTCLSSLSGAWVHTSVKAQKTQ